MSINFNYSLSSVAFIIPIPFGSKFIIKTIIPKKRRNCKRFNNNLKTLARVRGRGEYAPEILLGFATHRFAVRLRFAPLRMTGRGRISVCCEIYHPVTKNGQSGTPVPTGTVDSRCFIRPVDKLVFLCYNIFEHGADGRFNGMFCFARAILRLCVFLLSARYVFKFKLLLIKSKTFAIIKGYNW